MSSDKTIFIAIGIMVICFSAVSISFAWTTPTSTPPGNNIPLPLNASASTQGKLGNLAIGLANPSTNLDVNGTIRIRGGSPAAGSVLISDGSGLAHWGTCSAPVGIRGPSSPAVLPALPVVHCTGANGTSQYTSGTVIYNNCYYDDTSMKYSWCQETCSVDLTWINSSCSGNTHFGCPSNCTKPDPAWEVWSCTW